MIQQAYERILRAWSSLTDERRAVLLDRFAVSYAYASGKIENDAITLHDTRAVFEKGRVVSYTGDVRTLFEIQNLKLSWEWALETVGVGLHLDDDLVLEAHRLLTQGTYDERRWASGERPGTYKRGEYVVGVNGVGSAAIDVPHDVAELLEEVREYLAQSDQALTVAGYLHARLVDIHPFADGNGRTARLLMNMVLLSMGHPPITIPEEDRLPYFGALDAFHDEDDLNPFLDFLRAETVRTWERLLELTGLGSDPKSANLTCMKGV